MPNTAPNAASLIPCPSTNAIHLLSLLPERFGFRSLASAWPPRKTPAHTIQCRQASGPAHRKTLPAAQSSSPGILAGQSVGSMSARQTPASCCLSRSRSHELEEQIVQAPRSSAGRTKPNLPYSGRRWSARRRGAVYCIWRSPPRRQFPTPDFAPRLYQNSPPTPQSAVLLDLLSESTSSRTPD